MGVRIIGGIYWGLTLGPIFYSHYHSESSKQPMRCYYMHFRGKASRVKYLAQSHRVTQTWKENLKAFNLTSNFGLRSSFFLKIPFIAKVKYADDKKYRKTQIFNFSTSNAFVYFEKQNFFLKVSTINLLWLWRVFMCVWIYFSLFTLMAAYTCYFISFSFT